MTHVKIQDICKYIKEMGVDFECIGNKEIEINGYSSLINYKKDTMTWIKSGEFLKTFPLRSYHLIISPKGIDVKAEAIIFTDQPRNVFFMVLDHFFGSVNEKKDLRSNTYISDKVSLGRNVSIGCNCTINGNIIIGDDTVISNNVVIVNDVRIGKNCQIQSLSVIGEDGFGWTDDGKGVKTMIQHHGGVVIGDNVFIGSHVNIARGVLDDTEIGNGVKIAPSTHIGHNNKIGDNSVIICSNLFGSVILGDNTYVVSSTIKNQIKVGNNTIIGMGSVVTKNIEENKIAFGIPAKAIKDNER